MAISRFSWITAMALGCWAVAAEGQQSTDTTTPPGMVAFFMTDSAGCPAGWKVPDLPKGRIVVGALSGSVVGVVVVKDPMHPEQAPKHFHALTLTFDLKSKNIAASGGDNEQGAKSGKHSFTKQTDLAESGWGFTQLTVCEKQ